MNTTIATQLAHRSIRSFRNEAIDDEALAAILDAGHAASTSSFMQCTHIIRVRDKALRRALCELAANQVHIVEAAEFLVFCLDYAKHHTLLPAAQTDWTEALLIGGIDAGIMAQNCLLAAESLGLGGVFIGALRNDMAGVAQLLELPEHTAPLFGLCLGHPAESPAAKPRMPRSMMVSDNRYRLPDMQEFTEYNQTLGRYYQTRGKSFSFSDSVRKVLDKPLRPHVLPFLHTQGLAKR